MHSSINDVEYILDTNNKYLLYIYTVNACHANEWLSIGVHSTPKEKQF